MLAEMINKEAPELEEPSWDEFTPSEVKEGLVEFTYRPELPDVNRTRGRRLRMFAIARPPGSQ